MVIDSAQRAPLACAATPRAFNIIVVAIHAAPLPEAQVGALFQEPGNRWLCQKSHSATNAQITEIPTARKMRRIGRVPSPAIALSSLVPTGSLLWCMAMGRLSHLIRYTFWTLDKHCKNYVGLPSSVRIRQSIIPFKVNLE